MNGYGNNFRKCLYVKCSSEKWVMANPSKGNKDPVRKVEWKKVLYPSWGILYPFEDNYYIFVFVL